MAVVLLALVAVVRTAVRLVLILVVLVAVMLVRTTAREVVFLSTTGRRSRTALTLVRGRTRRTTPERRRRRRTTTEGRGRRWTAVHVRRRREGHVALAVVRRARDAVLGLVRDVGAVTVVLRPLARAARRTREGAVVALGRRRERLKVGVGEVGERHVVRLRLEVFVGNVSEVLVDVDVLGVDGFGDESSEVLVKVDVVHLGGVRRILRLDRFSRERRLRDRLRHRSSSSFKFEDLDDLVERLLLLGKLALDDGLLLRVGGVGRRDGSSESGVAEVRRGGESCAKRS